MINYDLANGYVFDSLIAYVLIFTILMFVSVFVYNTVEDVIMKWIVITLVSIVQAITVFSFISTYYNSNYFIESSYTNAVGHIEKACLTAEKKGFFICNESSIKK